MSCQPCTPPQDEFPIFCDPNPATDVGQRLLVEDEAFCTKALVSPETGSTLVWEDGIKWKEPTPEDTFNETTPFLAEGTTEPRNLVTRFADVVNVKDFGAVGDYTTDDTAAIQAAINSLPNTGGIEGGSVYLPKGRYRITSTLTINTRNTSLIGDGDGGQSNTLSIETLNNVSAVAPKGATQIIGDFVNGPIVHVKKHHSRIYNISIDSTGNQGDNTPISTGSLGRKGGGDSTNGHGILIQPDDGINTDRFMIERVSVYNQPSDGILCINSTVCSRIDFVTVNCCNRHAINVQNGAYVGLSTISRPGQIQFNNCNTSRCGGHGLLIGGHNEGPSTQGVPYRMEINNFESFYNLITPAYATIPSIPANCFLSGENHMMFASAFDGRTRFGGTENDPYIPIYVEGRNITIDNFRSISGAPYGAYVGDSSSIGTRGVTFNSFYVANDVDPSHVYDPAIYVQNSSCRGVRAFASLNMGQVPANLINKIQGSQYEEHYERTTKTDRSYKFLDNGSNSGITSNNIYCDSYRSSLEPAEINISNNQAFYIEFDGPTRGFLHVSGNTPSRKSGIFHFRTGDASAGAEKIGGSATNVATTIGALTGTTGSIGNLTFSVDNTLNRVYIENRTGADGAYTFVITNLNQGRKINAYAPSI